MRLGIGTETISAKKLLRTVLEEGRRLGLVRLMSELDSLSLPFQNTRLERHISSKGVNIRVDLDAYLRSLMQNAGLSLARLSEIKIRLRELEERFSSVADNELIHGKDAICIIERILAKFRIKRKEVEGLLWTSYEASLVERGSSLATVPRFLSRVHGELEEAGKETSRSHHSFKQ